MSHGACHAACPHPHRPPPPPLLNPNAPLHPPPLLYSAPPHQFIAENLQWTQQQVQQLSPSDTYWSQVGLNLAMLRGITAGFNEV